MQTTSNSQLEKQFHKSRRGAFAWIAALERLILRVPSLGDLYLADRVSGTLEHVAHLELMHTLSSRVMQDESGVLVGTRQENLAVNTLIEPPTREDLDTKSCSTLLSRIIDIISLLTSSSLFTIIIVITLSNHPYHHRYSLGPSTSSPS